jgi:hypothetical protein
MNNLYNIPGLIFKDGRIFLNDNEIAQCHYANWTRKLVLEFVCPRNPVDIKNLIKAYKMTNSKDWDSGIDEKRYQRRITGELFDIAFRVDVSRNDFTEMLNLTGCLQSHGGVKFGEPKSDWLETFNKACPTSELEIINN